MMTYAKTISLTSDPEYITKNILFDEVEEAKANLDDDNCRSEEDDHSQNYLNLRHKRRKKGKSKW